MIRLAFGVFMFLACASCVPTLSIAKHKINSAVETESTEACLLVKRNRSNVSIQLKPACAPKGSKYVEMVFDNSYYGYFLVSQTIYIPVYKGQKQITFYYSDALNKTLKIRKDYILR